MPRIEDDPFRRRGDSYATANRARPDARARERDRLLAPISIEPGMRVVDLQAAGGYVGEGLFERHGEKVTVLAIEPSHALVRTLPPRQKPIHATLESLPLRSGGVDVVLCLAGTHHSPDLQAILDECHRVLRPGGQVSISEVERGSAMDAWLNGFVDRVGRDGHRGRFVRPGELAAGLAAAGFADVHEERARVPWRFADDRELVAFCRGLFGLSAVPLEVVERGIREHLELRRESGETELSWSLRYASSVKPDAGGG